MFNVHVFLQALLFVTLLVILAGSVFVIGRHRYWLVQLVGLILAIVALAAAVGVICA